MILIEEDDIRKRVSDKTEIAIQRIKAFEPSDGGGYYLAFSGGKDSQCVYHLCRMAEVKFDAHYNVTSIDPPELIYFIRQHYPDVIFDRNLDDDGKPITMWNLIPKKRIPPTRLARYCCTKLKEAHGVGRLVITGVRWAESVNRANTHGVVTFPTRPKNTQILAEQFNANYTVNKRGTVILNDDNDENRRMVEQCFRTQKTMLNPIIDWSDDEVWFFLNSHDIPHCCLYDEGFHRIGCIGCPMNSKRTKEFDRWPKYKQLYLNAFDRMLQLRKQDGLETTWTDKEDVMNWWIDND